MDHQTIYIYIYLLLNIFRDKHRAKPLNVDEEKLLRVFYEFKIQDACQAFEFPHKIQSLDFDLIVYAPYRSVEGFLDCMEEFCQAKNGQLQMLQNLLQAARVEVDKTMLTEAPLLFPPEQVANRTS